MILIAVLGAALVGFLGFVLGDRRRRLAGGATGPRPARSVGEGLELARTRRGQVVVLFLGDDEESRQVGTALASSQPVIAALSEPLLIHVVLRAEKDGADLLEHLYQKYAEQPLPGWPAFLAFGSDGEMRDGGVIPPDLAGLLRQWVPPRSK